MVIQKQSISEKHRRETIQLLQDEFQTTLNNIYPQAKTVYEKTIGNSTIIPKGKNQTIIPFNLTK